MRGVASSTILQTQTGRRRQGGASVIPSPAQSFYLRRRTEARHQPGTRAGHCKVESVQHPKRAHDSVCITSHSESLSASLPEQLQHLGRVCAFPWQCFSISLRIWHLDVQQHTRVQRCSVCALASFDWQRLIRAWVRSCPPAVVNELFVCLRRNMPLKSARAFDSPKITRRHSTVPVNDKIHVRSAFCFSYYQIAPRLLADSVDAR